MIEVVPLAECDQASHSHLIREATEIFFETASVKVFESEVKRRAFYRRWFGRYLEADPSSFLLAIDQNGKAVGYLAGCVDSFAEKNQPIIKNVGLYTPAFSAALKDYPSHLHINVKPGRHGHGIGHRLMTAYFKLCRDQGSTGIHVVTDSQSRAVRFYEACGFKPLSVSEADPDLALLVYSIG